MLVLFLIILILVLRLNTDLKQTELVHGISRRWRPEDPEYRQLEQVYTSSLQASLLSAIHDCCVIRKFLLNVKAKYAGLCHIQTVIMVDICCLFKHRWPKDRQKTVFTDYQRNEESKEASGGV